MDSKVGHCTDAGWHWFQKIGLLRNSDDTIYVQSDPYFVDLVIILSIMLRGRMWRRHVLSALCGFFICSEQSWIVCVALRCECNSSLLFSMQCSYWRSVCGPVVSWCSPPSGTKICSNENSWVQSYNLCRFLRISIIYTSSSALPSSRPPPPPPRLPPYPHTARTNAIQRLRLIVVQTAFNLVRDGKHKSSHAQGTGRAMIVAQSVQGGGDERER